MGFEPMAQAPKMLKSENAENHIPGYAELLEEFLLRARYPGPSQLRRTGLLDRRGKSFSSVGNMLCLRASPERSATPRTV